MRDKNLIQKILQAGTLILAGEIVFILPFVVTRIFRPTFLHVFEISNFQLGSAFSVYGVVAMLSYLFGGPLADKFEPRKLITFSLIATSIGGIWLSQIPNIYALTFLYGFWGMSTILLFWAAFTKSTRIWGNEDNQGKAFGLIDAGRGLVAAVLATFSVVVIEFFLPNNIDNATKIELSKALSAVITFFAIITFLTAILTWFFVPNNDKEIKQSFDLKDLRKVTSKKSIWKQAIILLCAYVAYKCTDDYSLFASDVLGYNDVNAAFLATIAFWTRPVAAFIAGWLGDKYYHSKMVTVCFIIILIGSLVIFSGIIKPGMGVFTIFLIAAISAGIFGLRGLYYALFQESKISLTVTGSAIGIVSVIGFTPDIFFGPLMGYILDNYPGSVGHEYLFGVLAMFSLVGIITSLRFK